MKYILMFGLFLCGASSYSQQVTTKDKDGNVFMWKFKDSVISRVDVAKNKKLSYKMWGKPYNIIDDSIMTVIFYETTHGDGGVSIMYQKGFINDFTNIVVSPYNTTGLIPYEIIDCKNCNLFLNPKNK